MPREAKLRPNPTLKGWCLNVPKDLSSTGKRQRLFYRTREEAKTAAKTYRDARDKFGAHAVAIGPSLAEQAVKAQGLLKPLGIGLLDAVRDYAAAEMRRRSSVPVEDALAEYQEVKETLSESQVQAIRHMAARLLEDFKGRQLASIELDELEAHIDAHTGGDGAFNSRRRLIVTFWRWSAKPPRRWCDPSVAQEIETKDYTKSEIGVLTAAQAKALLVVAEKHYSEAVPGLAIAMFTGMRSSELGRLVPGDITDEGITVATASAKSKRRRFIEMTPTLQAWLEAHPISQDSVLCSNFRRKLIAIRRRAGWRVWTDLVEPNDPPRNLPKWPENALRHTHATVAIATGATLEDLTFAFGHAGGAAVLKSHYVGKMPKREALKILSIGPNGMKVQTTRAA